MFSQGSVATRLRCGGIFPHFIANLLLDVPVKEFWKSANTGCTDEKYPAAF